MNHTRVIFTILLVSLSGVASFAQNFTCGTTSDSHDRDQHKKRLQNMARVSDDTLFVALQIHAVGYQEADFQVNTPVPLPSTIDSLNGRFAMHKIQFVQCGPYLSYVDNDIYGTVNGNEARDLRSVPGVVNLFIVGSAGNAGGFALPGKDQAIVATGSNSFGVMAHELGHVLGLPHTFVGGDELVDGSNCQTAGDLFCDTPADPNVFGQVDSDCQYFGEAVDANGDTYQPDVSNIMGYAPDQCRFHFSVEQGSYMRWVLENEKWYLLRDRPEVEAAFVDADRFCANDTMGYPFTTQPQGGSMAGLGIVDSLFYPELAGPGIHELLYQSSFVADSIVRTFDYVNPNGYPTHDTLNVIWQNWVSNHTGVLVGIRHFLRATTETELMLEVFAGVDLDAMPILSQSIMVQATSDLEWIEIDCPEVLVNEGDTMTYRLTSSTDIIVQKEWGNFFNAFIDGQSNWGDFSTVHAYSNCYSVLLKVAQDCGNSAYFYAVVDEVEQGSILGLNLSYCLTGDSVPLRGVPETGEFALGAQLVEVLYPSEIGLGEHLVSFTSTDLNGCESTVSQSVLVEESVIGFESALGPFCDTISSIDLSAVLNDGLLFIEEQSVTSISPLDFGPGMHQGLYTLNTVNDTIIVADQSAVNSTGEGAGFLTMQPDSLYWQSFLASESGYLHSITMSQFGIQDKVFEVSLYQGEGISGDLITTDTVTLQFSSDPPYFSDIMLPTDDIEIVSGSLYTIAYRWIGNLDFPVPSLTYVTADIYPSGRSSFDAEADFLFVESVRNYLYCRDSMDVSIEVVECFPTSLMEDDVTDLNVYPNPSQGILSIEGDIPIQLVTLRALTGAQVYQARPITSRLTIEGLSSGTYLLEVQTSDSNFKELVVVH